VPPTKPDRVWNRITDNARERIIRLALNDRFGSNASFLMCAMHFRFTPNTGHIAALR
jgi:hypothetical protein